MTGAPGRVLTTPPLPLHVTISARPGLTPGGCTDIILHAPPRWQHGLTPAAAAGWLRIRSDRLARKHHQILRHAEWIITADPDVIRARRLHHPSPRARLEVHSAVAWLAAHPATPVAAGTLWWAS